MSIDANDMVDYAYQILQSCGNDSPEMELRNVINRAYYGAFLSARDNEDITYNNGSVHQDVSSYYFTKKSRISNNLDSLKRLRQVADYEPHRDISKRDARNCCRTARSILRDLSD